MGRIHLVRVGAVSTEMVKAIGHGIGETLGCLIKIHCEVLCPDFAFDARRSQYHSTEILTRLETLYPGLNDPILGIAEVDLFIPILTFVFGEAFLGRPPAVISLHRLHPQFYGLPDDSQQVLQRAQTESVHELGHTFGLIHCPNYACVMHASRVADEIDLKGPGFCPACLSILAVRI